MHTGYVAVTIVSLRGPTPLESDVQIKDQRNDAKTMDRGHGSAWN